MLVGGGIMIHRLMPEERDAVVKRIDAITDELEAETPTVLGSLSSVKSRNLRQERTQLRRMFVASELGAETGDAVVAQGSADDRRIAHLKEIPPTEGERPALDYFARLVERWRMAKQLRFAAPLSRRARQRIDRFLGKHGILYPHLTVAELYAIRRRIAAIDEQLKSAALIRERTILRAQLVSDSAAVPRCRDGRF
jgi:hypothetical protein